MMYPQHHDDDDEDDDEEDEEEDDDEDDDEEEDDEEEYDEEDEEYNFKYLTSKTEIPAYVRGLIKRSKVKKITLDDAMDEWYSENKKKFTGGETEWKKVKKTWKKYAEESKKTNRVKKYT